MANLQAYRADDGQPRLRLVRHARGPEPVLARYEVKHAPHDETVAGKEFKGGEFVPKGAESASTPAGKASVGAVRSATLLKKGQGGTLIPAAKTGLKLKVDAAKAQAANPARRNGVGFVSPETGEGLDLSAAAVRLFAGKQGHFQALAKRIDAHLGLRTSVDPGIGHWAPEGQEAGAEPTTVTTFRNAPDFNAIKYATAAKAYAANQHQALAFGCDPKGPDRLWSMMVAAELSGLAETLKKHGIDFKTVRLGNGGKHDVMIYDQGGALAEKVKAAADELGVKNVAVRSGRGEFLGGDGSDRRQARKKYRSFMRAYERRHPDRPHWDWSRS